MATKKTKKIDKRVIVRTYSAGVFFAEIVRRKGQEAVLKNARRLWYWSGAASLSQLANEGVANPGQCKFPAPVSEITVTQVVEILKVSPKAAKSIDGVSEWRA